VKNMEYVYAALVLHELGVNITATKVKGILEAAGAKIDESRVKALVAALKEVNVEEALKTAVTAAAPVAAAPVAAAGEKSAPKEKKKKEKPEEEENTDLGLGALFG
jgi:large subunit ribosomal protein L12